MLQATIDSPLLVARESIALVSCGFGLTMAAGVLIRYPDLPVRFLIDWQGPVSREEIAARRDGRPDGWHCRRALVAGARPSAMLRLVPVGYQRVQTCRPLPTLGKQQFARSAPPLTDGSGAKGSSLDPAERQSRQPGVPGRGEPWWLTPVPTEIGAWRISWS